MACCGRRKINNTQLGTVVSHKIMHLWIRLFRVLYFWYFFYSIVEP